MSSPALTEHPGLYALADLHLSPSTRDTVWRALEAVDSAMEEGEVLLLLGDLFDQGEILEAPLVDGLMTRLEALPGPTLIIPGNHDQYAPGKSFLHRLDLGPSGKVRVFDRPCRVAGVGYFVPHVPQRDFAAAVGKALGPKARVEVAGLGAFKGYPPVLFCHQGFRGAFQNAMRVDRTGIPLGALDFQGKVRLVVSGHYHMPQNLGNLIYVGSHTQHGYREEGQDKGFLHWPAGTSFVPKRYALAVGPRYITIPWDGEGDPPGRPETADPSDRVRVRTPAASRADLTRRVDALKGTALEGVPVVASAVDVKVQMDGAQGPLEDAVWDALFQRVADTPDAPSLATFEDMIRRILP